MEGNFPEFIVDTKYLHSSMKPWGVTDFPRTLLGFNERMIVSLNSLISFTKSGLNRFSGKELRFCKSLSFSVGRIKVKQFLSSKKVFNFFLIEFFLYAAFVIQYLPVMCYSDIGVHFINIIDSSLIPHSHFTVEEKSLWLTTWKMGKSLSALENHIDYHSCAEVQPNLLLNSNFRSLFHRYCPHYCK